MSRYIIVISIFVGFMFAGCNSEKGSQQGQNIPTAEDQIFPLTIQKGGNTMSLEQIRAQARTLVDHRIGTESEPLAMLTVGIWWPEFVYNKGSISGQGHYDGYWLDFKDDFWFQLYIVIQH